MVKEDIQERRGIVLNGQLFHVQCSSDVLSRMAQSSFELIDEIIDKVQLLSWSKSLPLWYLTTSKLKSALELEAMGEFADIDDHYEVPSEEEWGKVRSICRITDRIYGITKPLYEAKKQTANLFFPHLLEIRTYLAQESASSDPFVKAVAQDMLKTYTTYWNDMYPVLAIAAFMDPRYKMRLIEFSASKLQCDEKAAHVVETIRKLYDGYAVETEPKEYVLSDESDDEEDWDDEDGSEMQEDKEPDNVMDKMEVLKEFCAVQSVNDKACMSDLDQYLAEPVLPWTENFSVLHWWKDNCSKYPQLSRMARDFLAIPMSLATSYEAYYTEPREPDSTLASLKPELMNALMCTRSWKLGCKNRH